MRQDHFFVSGNLCTENCVICHAPAVIWGGHVHYGNTRMFVMAGYCPDHRYGEYPHDSLKDCWGCYGEWKPEYGLRKDYP